MHAGLEVSKLVETLFLGHLRKSPFYKERKYKDALIDAFRSIDETINSKTG